MMIGLEADKSYAYMLGVYLGDGSVRKLDLRYAQNTIDEDFKDAVINAVNAISKANVCVWYAEKPKKNCNCSPSWNVCFSDKAITTRFVNDTDSKAKIPAYVFKWPDELKKQFIIGLMDSEGYVAKQTISASKWRLTNRSYFMGYKSCDAWVNDLKTIMESVGIRFGKCQVESNSKTPNRKPSTRLYIKMQSWVDSGMRFNIARKQSRVDEWAAVGPYERRALHPRRLISETSTQGAIHG